LTNRALLEVLDLSVSFDVPGGPGGARREVRAVKHASFELDRGETVALVGESGSGKTVTALSVMQLLPYPLARHPSGSILLGGQELLGAPEEVMRRVRGNRIAMIFQEPMTSLNPVLSIGRQLTEGLEIHLEMASGEARGRAVELLAMVGIITSSPSRTVVRFVLVASARHSPALGSLQRARFVSSRRGRWSPPGSSG